MPPLALFTLLSVPPAVLPDLVTVRPGTIPVIVSAPHGGRTAIPGVPERKGTGIAKFVIVNDTNTDRLADKLAAALAKALGGPPHLVVARFARKSCDANRPTADAFEHPWAKAYYDRYHAGLAAARAAVQRDFGRGLLLDLHGQAADAAVLFRGTNDGKTVAHLTDRFGRAALTGPKSVLGQLAAKGYAVFPPNDAADEKERGSFSGGYIVQTYGSRYGGTVDAIQFETGGQMRAAKALDASAADIAAAVAAFAAEYLPAKKKSE